MLSITISTLKSDIAGLMKGTSVRQIKDFEATAFQAANRMLGRLDTEETRRTATLSTPFWDNVNDYVLPDDYKRMVDIRPQANRDLSHFEQTSPRQFNERLTPNSFSIRWNNMVRTLRAQRLPAGNVVTLDSGDSPTANGSWSVAGDASNIGTESLNYVQGNGAISFDLSGSTGSANIVNTTASVVDLSDYDNNDASMLYVYIPVGKSGLFNSFTLRRGTDATNYIEKTVTTKADGTAFTDGWNFLLFNWSTGTTTGSPSNENNTYRYFGIAYDTGTAVTGFLLDSWTNSLGELYEIEYYSEYLFRTSAGTWLARPTDDTDLVNVGPLSYEILKAEMMVDITQQVRTGNVQQNEFTHWFRKLHGQPESRWVKNPADKGLYSEYETKFPSSAIVTATRYYDFDV